MTLPSTGPISLGNIQSEFGGSNPTNMSEYYRAGSYVDNVAPNYSIPSSGAISISQFRGKQDIPYFNATLKWAGGISNGSTLDASSFVTTPYSTLVVIQHYFTGGEPFYYIPTAKLNGTDMSLIKSEYSNARDDGTGYAISTKSVAQGDSAVVTFTSAYSGTGYVYEVVGFRNMAAALHSVGTNNVLNDGNNWASRNTTVNIPTRGIVLVTALGSFGNSSPFEINYNNIIGWDTNPTPGSVTYSGGDRITIAASFNLDLA